MTPDNPDQERHREEYAAAYENLKIYKPEQSMNDLRKLLEERDKELAQLRESLKTLSSLLESVEKNPKALKGFLNKISSEDRQRLLTFTKRWSKKTGLI